MSGQFLDDEGLNQFWRTASESLLNEVDKIVGDVFSGVVVPTKAPIGAIVWWSGTADNIPDGWHICDGEAGTLDLSGRFILAVSDNHPVGETEGEEKHTLSLSEMPAHSHAYSRKDTVNSIYSASSGTRYTVYNGTVIDINTTRSGGDQPHNNMPPYYVLCAIQKIGVDETDGLTIEQVNALIDDKLGDIGKVLDEINGVEE